MLRVYIDGFNLYYGALKDSHDKWLDIVAWARVLAPNYDIEKVTYCTARVKPQQKTDPAPMRQEFYLRALGSLGPLVEILEGQYRLRDVRGARKSDSRCSCCSSPRPCFCCSRIVATVTRSEEKGSDVNLAVRLVRDAFQASADAFMVVSNDSDLQEAVNTVEALGKTVIAVNPHIGKVQVLKASQRRTVRRAGLSKSQFPSSLQLPDGSTVHKPTGW